MAVKRKSEKAKVIEATPSYLPKAFFSGSYAQKNKNLIIFLSLVILGLIAVFFLKRSWLVAATVDGSSISNYTLQTRLNQDYKKQALDQLVNEEVVQNEAKKNNISVSSQEVLEKIKEYEEKYGGAESFASILEQQGTTREALQGVIKTQIYLEKLYSKEATVSSQEVDDYLKTNKGTLVATGEAEQQVEAEKNIKEQKLFKIFSQKFQELKDKAKVNLY